MKLPPLLLSFVFALAGSLPAFAQSSGVGDIEGRVFNAATGAALHDALVQVDGTRLETTTDEYGNYRLVGAPVGAAQLSVSYIGLKPQTATVTVSAGAVTHHLFDLEVPEEPVKLGALTVTADQFMSAEAVAQNEQKNASTDTLAVAYDEYGDISLKDENFGELMRFLPGVAVDQGGQTASTISLRGFPSANTSIYLDGAEIAGARGNSRTLSMLDIPTAGIATVDVTKLPTPDMPASGMGGSINIITKSGFDVKAPELDYSVYLMTDQYTGYTFDGGRPGLTNRLSPSYQQPSFDFSFLYPVSDKVAISIGGARSWRLKPMERNDHLDTNGLWSFTGGFQRQDIWRSLDNIIYSASGQVGIDWKISDRDLLRVNVEDRYVSNNIMRLEYEATYGTGATGNASYTQGASTAVGSVSQGLSTNRETGSDTAPIIVLYSHRGDDWKLDAMAAASRSRSFEEDVDNGEFDGFTATISSLVLRGSGLGSNPYSDIPTTYSATTAAGAPVDIFGGENFVLGNPTSSQDAVYTQRRSLKLDVTRDFDGPIPVTVKVGGYYDQQVRDQKVYDKTWTFEPNGATTSAAKIATNFDVFDSNFNAQAPTIFGQPVAWISDAKYYQLMVKNPSWFVLNQPLYNEDYDLDSTYIRERIGAAYVRGDVHLLDNRLLIVGGVRFEKTEDYGQGPLTNPNAAVEYVERGAISDQNYDNFFPSAIATYHLTDKLLTRFGYSETIARPDLSQIIPGTSIASDTSTNLTITVNNTGLKPWTARSFDFSLESYDLAGGHGTLGVFDRQLSNFFNSVTTAATPALLAQYGLGQSYSDYDITTLTNGGSARMTGIEFGYEQKLLFLPQWAYGVQLFFNTTQLHLTGSYSADFTGLAPTTYAGGVELLRPRFDIRLNWNYQSVTNTGAVAASAANGIPNGIFNWQGAVLRMGLNWEYSLTKHYAIYGAMSDLNDPGFNLRSLEYGASTPYYERQYRLQNLGGVWTIGFKGKY